MRKFVTLMFFLTFCLALWALQNVSDFAVLQNPVAAQINNTSYSAQKQNDSALNTWQIKTDNSKTLIAVVTTRGKTPNGAAQTTFRLQCSADQSSIVSIDYIVHDALKIKDFEFSDFEGPDAPAGNKKLVELRATSPSGNLSLRTSVAGYYRSESEPPSFYFTISPTTQNKVVRLAKMIARGSTEVTVIVRGYRNNQETIETAFPAIDAASDAAKTLNGCQK